MVETGPDTPFDSMRQPLLAHLIELRKRLIWSLAAIVVGFCICYTFAPQIYEFLVRPLAEASGDEPRRLIYTGLTEAFVTYIKLSFVGRVPHRVSYYRGAGLDVCSSRPLQP